MYNKRKFNKINDKKVLHKVKKQWVVLSLSMLAMIGAGGAIATQAHASTVNAPQVQEKQASQNNTDNIGDKASAMHNQLVLNTTMTELNNNSTKGISSQNKIVKNEQNDKTSDDIDNNAPKRLSATPDSIIKGYWENNTNTPYSFDKTTGVLKTTGDGQIESVGDIQTPGFNKNDVKEIDVEGYNNTIFPPATSDFGDLPNLQTINLSGLNTNDMVSAYDMFANDPKLRSITLGNDFDTHNVSTMYGMFTNDPLLSTINFGNGFKTNNVTNMSYMFANDPKLRFITLGNGFDTHNVSTMYGMFTNDPLLSTINFGNSFNTSNVTNMSYMFANDPKLSSLDLSSFNTSNVNDMSYMFYKDTNISDLNLSNFDTGTNNGKELVTHENMSYMLTGLVNLKTLHLGTNTILPNTANMPNNVWYKKYSDGYTSETPTDMWAINNDLAGTYVLTPNVNPNKEAIISGKWGSAPYQFNPVTGVLKTIGPGTINDISNITQLNGINDNIYQPNSGSVDPSKIRKIQFAPGTKAPNNTMGLFASAKLSVHTRQMGTAHYSSLYNLRDIDLKNLDTSNVNTMHTWFAYDPDLQHIYNLSDLNTSSVQNMNGMFESDNKLLSVNMSSLNMSKVQYTQDMFKDDNDLTHLLLSSNLGVSSLLNTSNMFNNIHNLKDINLSSNFNTSDVSDMSGMFSNDTNLSDLNLGPRFSTKSATNMSDMFSGDSSLKSLNLGPNFNTVNVTNMHDMFGYDINLQVLNLGNNFVTQQASNNSIPKYVGGSHIEYENGASDVFLNDKLLNTIIGNDIQLDRQVTLPNIPNNDWYLQKNNRITGNPVDLTNGNQYAGTYVLSTANPIVQTTLQFMDGSNNIGDLVVTGYNNTPIPYGLIDDSLGDGYSPDIPGKELATNIPNSPYEYKNGTIQVPVKHDGDSTGSNPVSATYVTLQGDITLNFTDYKNSNIKTLTIPYQIDGVPVGSKVSNILSYAAPSVTDPHNYLGKTIQSFPISDYSYQNESNGNSYLNIPITVSDGKNASGQYEDGNPVNHNLTFNFKSNKVNEHITYEYKSTNEGSTDIQGDPGTKGNDDNAYGVTPGFVPTPDATTSFTFNNNSNTSMTIPVQREKVTIPFKVEDDNSHQVLNGLSNVRSSNKLTVNEASDVTLNSNDLNQLVVNDGYKLDNNQIIKVPTNKVNYSTHTYDGNDFVLYAHKFNIIVPVQFMYDGRQKGTSSLTGTMNDTISNIDSKLASAVPAGYQIDPTNSNKYTITHISSESNDKYQTSPFVVNLKPISTINYIKYMNNGQQIGSSYKVSGYDSRAGLGHDTFTINSKQPASLENGYHVDNDNQTINLDNGTHGTHTVNVSPDIMSVPVEFKDVTSGSFLNYSPNANDSFTVNIPGTINFGNNVLSELQREGYQLSHNNYSFTITPNEVRNNGTLYPGYEPTFNVTPIQATSTINYKYNGHDVTDKDSTKSVTGNQSVGKTTFDLASLTVPNGYQLSANNPAADAYKSGHVIVNVTPVQATDAIVYKNGSQTVASDSNSTNSVKGNKVIAPNSFNTNSLVLPNGYQLVGNGATYTYNGNPVKVQVAPKPTMTTIHYEYNGQPLTTTTKPGVYNASFDTSSLNLPNGYNLANSNQTVPDNNANVTVNLVPQQKTDTINFVDGQGNVSTTHVTGNSSATDLASSYFTVGNTPTGLPSGYQVEDPSQVINYDGNNHNIMIKPVVKPTPKPQSGSNTPVTPAKPSSGSTASSSVKPNSSSTGSSASSSASANTSKNGSSANSSASSSNVKPTSSSTNSSSASHNASSASTNNSKSNSSTSSNVQPSSANSNSTTSSANTSKNNSSASSSTSNSAKPSSMNSSHASSTNSSSTNAPKSSTANSTASNSTQPSSTNSNTSKSNGSINSSTSMNSSAKSNSTSGASNTSNASSTSTNVPESNSAVTPIMPVTPIVTTPNVMPSSVANISTSSNASISSVSVATQSISTNDTTPYRTRTNQGYVMQHNADHGNHDVIMYHGHKHVVHYHANGKNTIRVRVNDHYKNVVVSTDLPTNNVPEAITRAVDTINFNAPAKHVWSWKSANRVLNQTNVGEVISHYGTKMARISVPAHYRYFIVNKQALAHLLINKVGNVEKRAIGLRKNLVFHINRIVAVHGKRGNYVRYEFRFNKRNFWVTANRNYVKNAYLQTSDVKGRKIRVIRKCCLYTSSKYNKHTLVRSIEPGVKLSVRKVILLGKRSNYQTRLLLSNGDYITANKQFVEVI